VELWDLVSAFARILRESAAQSPSNILYDETPIQVYIERIHTHLAARGRMAFRELFEPGQHKSALIGMFLAVLELVRHHGVRVEQDDSFGDIWIVPAESGAPIEAAETDYRE
jgi:segregation and condensation protein A